MLLALGPCNGCIQFFCIYYTVTDIAFDFPLVTATAFVGITAFLWTLMASNSELDDSWNVTSCSRRSAQVGASAKASTPLPRPQVAIQPRLGALLGLTDPSTDSHATTGHAFWNVSDLECNGGLSRPLPAFHNIASVPQPTGLTPLPLPPLRRGYMEIAGPTHYLHCQDLVSPMKRQRAEVDTTISTNPALAPKPWKPSKLQQLSGIHTCSTNSLIQTVWGQFLDMVLPFSPMLQSLQTSPNFDAHCWRILDSFSVSTVYRYCSILLQFQQLCRQLRLDMNSLTEVQLGDALVAGRSSEPRVGSSMCIKAMRWALKQFQVSCFQHAVGPLISSFTKEYLISDRREALPYSLLTLVQWERRILQRTATRQEVLGLGCFLLMSWSGMRFGDLQRTKLSSLSYDGSSLRGLAFKTKTSKSGCPFGIVCQGFLSHGSFTWVHRLLQELDALYAGLSPSDIDFVFPSLDHLDSSFPEPMSYGEALFLCRKFLSLPWRQHSMDFGLASASYTVHGLKSTFLSWANQLQIDPELRRLQGKHKDPLQSTRLYSRDDVSGSLQLQRQIIDKVHGGWRPSTPLSRGGQCPIPEQPFQLEKIRKDVSDSSWSFFTFDEAVPFEAEPFDAVEGLDFSDSSSSCSTDSSAQGRSKPGREIVAEVPDACDKVSMGIYRKTWHVVMNVHTTLDVDRLQGIFTACGRKFQSGPFILKDTMDIQKDEILCSHSGCKKGWISMGILA